MIPKSCTLVLKSRSTGSKQHSLYDKYFHHSKAHSEVSNIGLHRSSKPGTAASGTLPMMLCLCTSNKVNWKLTITEKVRWEIISRPRIYIFKIQNPVIMVESSHMAHVSRPCHWARFSRGKLTNLHDQRLKIYSFKLNVNVERRKDKTRQLPIHTAWLIMWPSLIYINMT